LKTGKKAGRNNRNLTQQETPAQIIIIPGIIPGKDWWRPFC